MVIFKNSLWIFKLSCQAAETPLYELSDQTQSMSKTAKNNFIPSSLKSMEKNLQDFVTEVYRSLYNDFNEH